MLLQQIIILFFTLSLAAPSIQQSDSEDEEDLPHPKIVEKTLARALELHRESMSQITKRPTRPKVSPHDKGAKLLLEALHQPSTSNIELAKPSEDDIDTDEGPEDDKVADPDWDPKEEVLRLPQVDVKLKTMQDILLLREQGRSHDKIKKLYGWYNHKFIPRFRACVARGYKRSEVYGLIGGKTFSIFKRSREKGLPVRGYKIREWARREARKLDFPSFHASRSWLDSFKKKFRIRSRKVTKVVSQSYLNNLRGDARAIEEFREQYGSLSSYFRKKLIFNVDQTGFNLEPSTDRTLSHQGERDTIIHAGSRNKQSHSYTSQPIITRSGYTAGKLGLCFNEGNTTFGVRVIKRVQELEKQYGNIKVYAGTTHIMSHANQLKWTEDVLVDAIIESRHRSAEDDFESLPDASTLLRGGDQGMDEEDHECWSEMRESRNCNARAWPRSVYCDNQARHSADRYCLNKPEGLMLLDSWSGNKPIARVSRAFHIKPMTIPERTTMELQPLDVIFNRQYKIAVNRIIEQAHYDEIIKEVTSREGIMNFQSLLWNQFASPNFREMILWSWHKTEPDFPTQELSATPPLMVRAIHFGFNETNCEIDDCNNHPFIRCAHCGRVLCLRHFLERLCFHGDSSNAETVPIDREGALRVLGGIDDDSDDEFCEQDAD